MNFFHDHGTIALVGLAIFPRLTLLIGSFATGGFLWWLGWLIAPHLLVAILSLPYWHSAVRKPFPKPVRAQGEFTKHYLAVKGMEEIWEGMLTYNQVIPAVNTTYQDPEDAVARFGGNMANQIRIQAWKQLQDLGCDNLVAGRLANRVGDLRPWTRRDQELQKQLAVAFAGRLKPEIARGPLESLKLVVSRTYDDFVEMTKNLKIVD